MKIHSHAILLVPLPFPSHWHCHWPMGSQLFPFPCTSLLATFKDAIDFRIVNVALKLANFDTKCVYIIMMMDTCPSYTHCKWNRFEYFYALHFAPSIPAYLWALVKRFQRMGVILKRQGEGRISYRLLEPYIFLNDKLLLRCGATEKWLAARFSYIPAAETSAIYAVISVDRVNLLSERQFSCFPLTDVDSRRRRRQPPHHSLNHTIAVGPPTAVMPHRCS